jgi:hypothetical protein
MIPVNYFRFAWQLNARGQSGPRVNTIAGNYAATLTAPDYEGAAFYAQAVDWCVNAWNTYLFNLYSTATTLTGVAVSTHSGGLSTPVSDSTTGDRSGALAPPGLATIAQIHGQALGRKGRGRMFLPDVLESDFDSEGIVDGTWAAAVITNLSNLVGAMDNNITGSDFEQSLNGCHILHSDGSTPTRFDHWTVAPQPGYLRRRTRS